AKHVQFAQPPTQAGGCLFMFYRISLIPRFSGVFGATLWSETVSTVSRTSGKLLKQLKWAPKSLTPLKRGVDGKPRNSSSSCMVDGCTHYAAPALFSYPTDGHAYAQPLYVSAVAVPGQGTRNVAYVATQHNGVYAFDADSNAGPNGGVIWHTNLGMSAVMPNSDFGNRYGPYHDIN